MNRFFTKSIALVALVGAFTAFSATKSEAAFTASICDDAACSGMGDLFFTDADLDGVINALGAVGGAEVVLNLALSKPALTTGMDMTFNVTNLTGDPASVWLYATDDNFLGTPALHSHIGGTVDTGSVQSQVCVTPGGCVLSSVFTSGSYSEDNAVIGPFASPYSITLGVAVVGLAAGDTSSGDFRVVAPEPATLGLLGLGLAGLAARRRRQAR